MRIAGRLARLEKAVPRRCAGCAGGDPGMLFEYDRSLLTAQRQPVNEADLLSCPDCGRERGRWLKIVVGVDPALL